MKKLALIISGVTLVLASCQKVDVQPNTGVSNEAPAWDLKSRSVDQDDDQDVNTNPIVDPNDDEDGHGKRKV